MQNLKPEYGDNRINEIIKKLDNFEGDVIKSAAYLLWALYTNNITDDKETFSICDDFLKLNGWEFKKKDERLLEQIRFRSLRDIEKLIDISLTQYQV